jgi:hypothetical protein
MNYSLIMAIFWFLFGAGWLAAAWATGGKLPVIRLGNGVEFSPAWVALLLCVYNVVRWRLRPRRRPLDPLQETLEARRRMHRAEERPAGPPDPTFDFTDAPAPAPERRDAAASPPGDGPSPAG